MSPSTVSVSHHEPREGLWCLSRTMRVPLARCRCQDEVRQSVVLNLPMPSAARPFSLFLYAEASMDAPERVMSMPRMLRPCRHRAATVARGSMSECQAVGRERGAVRRALLDFAEGAGVVKRASCRRRQTAATREGVGVRPQRIISDCEACDRCGRRVLSSFSRRCKTNGADERVSAIAR